MRSLLAVPSAASAFAVAVCLVTPAHAQSFGQGGDVSFAADRLMGLYLYDEGGAKLTSIGFLAPPADRVYLTPRLGIDFFVIDHLSIGGSFAYWSTSVRQPGPDPSRSGFLFAPRVGYAINFSRSFGFWPRGGVTFRNIENDDEMALTLEGMFYGAPTPHFAFIFGPAIDVGMVGEGDEALSVGLLTAGILGWI